MRRPLTQVELRLGLDCALKLRYAREGLPQRTAEEESPFSTASARDLVLEQYWACFAPDVDARKATGARLSNLLKGAANNARSTGLPVRIRGTTFRVGDILSRVDELIVQSDRWDVAEIHAKRLPDEPAGLRTRTGAYLSQWKPLAQDLELSRQILERWLAENAAVIEVAPGLPVGARLIGLRETVSSQMPRSIEDFRLDVRPGGTLRISTRRGTHAEGEATFRRLQIAPEPLEQPIDRLVDLARTKAWPEPKSCYAVRCKVCEFRLQGDPDSGFARCWGSEAVYRPDHILNLPRISDAQLAAAVAKDGPSATFASLDVTAIRKSQEPAVATDGVVQLTEELDRWVRERKAVPADTSGNPRDQQAHFLSIRAASVPIPAWPGAQPYEVVPFQFSAHALPLEAGSLEERVSLPGFVRCDLSDPRRDFVDALRAQVSGGGPVFHWHFLDRMVLARIRQSIVADQSNDGDADRVEFIDELVGPAGRGGGRLIDLFEISNGYKPQIGALPRALRGFVRHAWRYERISRPFRSTRAQRIDPVIYDDPVDPAFELPLAPPARVDAGSNEPTGGISPLTPGAAAELWLQCRTGVRRDFLAVHEVLRKWGHLNSASVLIAHHFLVHVAPALAKQAADRTVRVFVSSTFRDFREERNLLKQEVEPTLNQRANDRMVQATIVDLRWGITNEQANRGLTLPMCLGEVARCRPYFIGLLGERYGWVPPPDAFAREVVDSMPWLQEHIGGSSVTELEIRHGALDASVEASDARFYFRDPAFAADKGGDFVSTDPNERRRLSTLKQAIRDRGFSVCDGYIDPRAFSGLVTEDLWDRIDSSYPPDLVGDASLEDWTAHQSRAARLLRNYQQDDQLLRALRSRLTDRNTCRIMISGAAGSGKSAFLAKAMEAYVGSAAMVPIIHFIGVGRTRARAADIALRVVRTARRLVGFTGGSEDTGEAPESIAALRTLGDAAVRRGAILAIALDGLDAVDDLGALEWLRGAPPNGIKLVMTALPRGPLARTAVKCRRSWTMRMAPLEGSPARRMLTGVLAWHGRTLSESQESAILSHQCASKPGYLRRLIDELTLSADHETVAGRLRECLLARSLAELHGVILRRVESELGHAFVARAMRTLMAQRAGLPEHELVSKLDNMQAQIAALRLRLGCDLVDAGGLISIPPGAFADAVRKRYRLR